MTKEPQPNFGAWLRATLRVAAIAVPLMLPVVPWAIGLQTKLDALGAAQGQLTISVHEVSKDIRDRPTQAQVLGLIDARVNETLLRLRITESLAELKQATASHDARLKEILDALSKR